MLRGSVCHATPYRPQAEVYHARADPRVSWPGACLDTLRCDGTGEEE